MVYKWVGMGTRGQWSSTVGLEWVAFFPPSTFFNSCFWTVLKASMFGTWDSMEFGDMGTTLMLNTVQCECIPMLVLALKVVETLNLQKNFW